MQNSHQLSGNHLDMDEKHMLLVSFAQHGEA